MLLLTPSSIIKCYKSYSFVTEINSACITQLGGYHQTYFSQDNYFELSEQLLDSFPYCLYLTVIHCLTFIVILKYVGAQHYLSIVIKQKVYCEVFTIN